jgi:hypothetical protein
MDKQFKRYGKRIKTAFFLTKFLKWFGSIIISIFALSFLILAIAISKSVGVIFFLGFLGFFTGFLFVVFMAFMFCNCPKCGQTWWSFPSLLGFGIFSLSMHLESGGDETETLKCRRCKLELGAYLKK